MGHEALRDQLLLAPQEWEEMPELAPWMKRMRVSRAQGIMSEERQQVPVTSILLPQVFGRWQIRYVQCKHLCEVELVLCTESSPFKTLVSSKAHKAGLTETAGVLLTADPGGPGLRVWGGGADHGRLGGALRPAAGLAAVAGRR